MSPSPSFSLPSSAKPFEAHRTRLLQSNNRPEPHKIAFFVDDLSDQQRRLDDLEEEFKAEYRLLKIRFTERKKHIKQVIQDNKSILSAIRRMPSEILREIFYFMQDPCVHSSLSMQAFMIWRLAQVLKTWREVALSFPRLWSTVMLDESDFDPDPVRSQRKGFLLGLQLQRAGQHLLEVRVRTTSVPPSLPLIYVLLPTTPRWRHFGASFHDIHAFAAFSTACASLQSLESIYVYVSGSFTADEIQKSSIQHLFRFAPRLNSIGTWMGNPQVLSHCDLPWSQITHYRELHAFTPLERPHFQILPSMTQLQYCQIDSQAIHVASHPMTELPQLVCLVLLGTHGIQILSKLSLPNLISLSSDISDDSLPDLSNLFSKLPSLRAFEL
ncbi:hypothetical protein C8J56DRAFT_1113528 [Mycena floridula]|nr:hypothetical protein C8J56DRAFT_1113528 [Mycena floridula]